MKHGDPIRTELEVLLAAMVEVGLSSTQKARLGKLLKDNTDAQRFYKRYLEVHAMLQWEAGTVTTPSTNAQDLQDLLRMEQAANAQMVHVIGQLRPATPIRHAALWAGLAACLMIAVTLTLVLITGSSNPNPTAQQNDTNPTTLRTTPATNPVATLTATHNAVWTSSQAEGASAPGSSGSLTPGSNLYPNQRLTLTAGFAEITTKRGAVAILEAPATIELLDNNNALRLHTGKLVGICETASSKGFVVRTPHMDITDLGTRFGALSSISVLTQTTNLLHQP